MAIDPDASQWSWDPSLYAGSAAYYAVGRVPYPAELAKALAAAVPLDGTGTLLDVGCGPGSLTLLLAPYVGSAVGVDADADMLTEANRLAAALDIVNVSWRQLRAEDLPGDLPTPMRLITLAQSFHWMDRPRVAAVLRAMLDSGGAVVHVSATTHWGVAGPDSGWSSPPNTQDKPIHSSERTGNAPPWRAIEDLVAAYLGPGRRAGQGTRSGGVDGEDAIYRAAGFTGPQRIAIPGWTVERTTAQIAAAVYSLSWAAPHLFGARFAEFDGHLRRLLDQASSDGGFVEQMRPIALDIWR